jgi:ubiquinone/menaquinone biosynthesis C-methylase UbiE
MKTGHRRLRTLEAGSGPGYCSSLIAAMDGEVKSTILDLDRNALNLAAQRDKNIQTVQGDLYSMPFANSSFDLVFNSSTMEHLSSFDLAFREMVRVAQPEGTIFVGVPYKYGPFLPFNLVPPTHPVSVWMGKLYSRTQLRKACQIEGLVEKHSCLYFCGCFVGVLLSKEGASRGGGSNAP